MTASALNIASIGPKAQPNAATQAGGGNALAGFEALLGALFPGGDPTAMAATPAAAALTGAAVAPANSTSGETKSDEVDAVADADADADAAMAGDTAAAVMASLMSAQTAAATTPTKAVKDDAEASPAWGRDKAKGVPAAPALANAAPNAKLAEKDGLVEDSNLPEEGASVPPSADGTAQAAEPKAIPAPNGDRAPPRPQFPERVADLPPPSRAADAVVEANSEREPALVDAIAAADSSATETALTARAEPPPSPATTPATAPKSAKSDRAKGASDKAEATADNVRAPETAGKSASATAPQRAAKANDAAVDAVEGKARETKAAPETPDATPMGETRAAAQSAAPASAHATHAVRGSPETVANLAAQIVKKLEGKSTRFDVELDPQGLGKVDVRVEIAASGRVTAAMTFDNPQAAADVKARAAELQRALEHAGFDLSGGLSFDVADRRGQQQNQAWQDSGDASRAFQGRAFRAALETAGDAAEAANQGALRLRRGINAGLDVRI